MFYKFSFTDNDYDIILKNANALLPGIEKIIAIYYDNNTDSIKSKIVVKPGKESKVEEYNITDKKELVLRYRTGKLNYNWYGKDELPFDIPVKKKDNDIFGESEKIVLLLRLKNENDTLSDLLFIYFNRNLSNFFLSRSDKQLTTDNKNIIASLLYNYFNHQINENRKNRSVLKTVNSNTRSLIKEANQLRNELQQTRLNYGESLVNLCRRYIQEWSEKNDKNYQLTDDAIDKIRNFKGNINNLYTIISNTVIYVDTLSYEEYDNVITLKAWHINMDDYQVKPQREKTYYDQDSKYVKTTQLLNKLENAARNVISSNKRLTSSNVGKALDKPITAPAITDSIQKHKQKIINLFDKYPEKWEIIKKNFKPIKNIIISDDDLNKTIA